MQEEKYYDIIIVMSAEADEEFRKRLQKLKKEDIFFWKIVVHFLSDISDHCCTHPFTEDVCIEWSGLDKESWNDKNPISQWIMSNLKDIGFDKSKVFEIEIDPGTKVAEFSRYGHFDDSESFNANITEEGPQIDYPCDLCRSIVHKSNQTH